MEVTDNDKRTSLLRTIKLFAAIIDCVLEQASVFVIVSHFYASLIFLDYVRAYPGGAKSSIKALNLLD